MQKKNFTLIELLVAIAIIGILASLLLPTLSKARKSSRHSVCINKIKQLSVITEMYADDNDDTYMLGWTNNTFLWDNYLIHLNYWGGDSTVTLEKEYAYYGCPERKDKPTIGGNPSYGLNHSISAWSTGPVIPRTSFRSPSELMSFIENDISNNATDLGWLMDDYRWGQDYFGHNGKSVASHADGHVASYTFAQMSVRNSSPDKVWIP